MRLSCNPSLLTYGLSNVGLRDASASKNGGLFGERPTGRGENNYFTVGQRPQVKGTFAI